MYGNPKNAGNDKTMRTNPYSTIVGRARKKASNVIPDMEIVEAIILSQIFFFIVRVFSSIPGKANFRFSHSSTDFTIS